ncbi:MAG: hypothetical protein ACKO3K_01260 [Cuspidothrix sp.]
MSSCQAYMASVYINLCSKLFDISPPHILAELGSPEKCHDLLEKAGFTDISIKVEPRGRYRNLQDKGLSWQLFNLVFKYHPLLPNPSQEQLEQLQVEYKLEIETLLTEQGVWEDTTTFFVQARK